MLFPTRLFQSWSPNRLLKSFLLGLLWLLGVTGLPQRLTVQTVAKSPEAEVQKLEIQPHQRIALVGNSTAERMNLFGNFETRLQFRLADQQPLIRNFGWPADAVSVQQRPGNYTKIDDPFLVFRPDLLICFFGFNESFDGDAPETLERFISDYRKYIAKETQRLSSGDARPRFVLVSPIAFESTGNPLQPSGEAENGRLEAYTMAIQKLAQTDGYPFVDLFHPTREAFAKTPGAQFTINGVHLNEEGDALVGRLLEESLLGKASKPVDDALFDRALFDRALFGRVREVVNHKAWLHLQDYRMLNGWYVYGGRRTWDTETFPGEYRKIRKMVAVRDRY